MSEYVRPSRLANATRVPPPRYRTSKVRSLQRGTCAKYTNASTQRQEHCAQVRPDNARFRTASTSWGRRLRGGRPLRPDADRPRQRSVAAARDQLPLHLYAVAGDDAVGADAVPRLRRVDHRLSQRQFRIAARGGGLRRGGGRPAAGGGGGISVGSLTMMATSRVPCAGP